MPVQHSPSAKNSRSQRHKAVLTPTASAPLDHTPSVHKPSGNLKSGTPREEEAPSRRGGVKSRRSRSFSGLLGGYSSISQGPRSGSGEAEYKEGEDSVEEKESEESEVEAALEGAPEASEAANLAHSNQPPLSKAKPNFLKMMEQITQAVPPRDNPRAPELNTPSMKAPDSFNGTQAHKPSGLIQYCE
ncbi:hypothetical protein O181_113385 [Austropuccinia psidii MF-1]|uniref:Uncharacterized protein n=1 Tax=Austropuccinia psidii MF-1 TaxID=1389203 RepID=A0A9Q3K6A7_9BASI|nr:hypothetical protein [Austropuccinia psidii MF-1]